MSNEDIKKVLVQYKRVSNMIRHIEDEIAQIDDKVLGIRENQMTGMPKGSSSLTMTDMLGEKRDSIEKIARIKHYTVRHGWRLYDEALTQVDMTINL